MKEPASERIFGLDLMRAVAILMVLCSHVLWIYPNHKNFFTSAFEVFGLWGVEIFFVLSGFLIGGILYKKFIHVSFGWNEMVGFLKRRWFRTLPNYYLVLVLNVIISIGIGYETRELWKYFFFLQNFNSKMLAFFPESWSLSVEEFTYLFLAIGLFVFGLLRTNDKSKKFFKIVFFIWVVSLFLKVFYHFNLSKADMNYWNLNLKSVVIYRIDAILFGVLMYWISEKFKEQWQKLKYNCLFIGIGLSFFIFAGISFFKIYIAAYPFFWNVFYLPLNTLAFALFLPFLSQLVSVNFSLFKKIIVFISKISYSIYLLHYCIVLQLLKFYIDTSNFSLFQLHLFTMFYLFVTFLLSFLLYKYFEKPIMDLRDK